MVLSALPGTPIMDNFVKRITVISGFRNIFMAKFHNAYLNVIEIIYEISQQDMQSSPKVHISELV